jgi:predicted AlkP superfamily phosphohydrolase/phosphomutase
MNRPKRVAVIGIDCPLPHLMEQMIAEGHLPTFKRLFEGGVFAENCLVPFPTITPPNWATIGTGANIGTHQVVDFWVPLPGKTPDSDNTVQAFSSERVKAEFIWDAADKAGKKCIVLNFPGAWPSKMKNGIMVGGAGLCVGDQADGVHTGGLETVCGAQLITTGLYPMSIQGKFEPAEGWANLSEPGAEPLELAAELNFPSAEVEPAPTTWYVLARQSAGAGYDRVSLAPSKDFHDAFFTIGLGEWSPKIVTNLALEDGTERSPMFRAKLVELSADAEEFRLLLTAMIDVAPWCSPPEVAAKLVSPEGTPTPYCGLVETMMGWVDWDTFVDSCRLYGQWVGDAAASLLEPGDWDLFFMHSHPPDFSYHVLLTAMDPLTNPDAVSRQKAWECHLRVYQDQDKMVERIVASLPPDTLVVLVSDHGATADGPPFDPFQPLIGAGLATVLQKAEYHDAVEKMAAKYGRMPITVDLAKAKALPRGSCYVNVHLKGRDPRGIVEPEDYQKVQLEIIDALYRYVDPQTGKRPVALALAKDDARLLGLYGEAVGDVVYATYPWFGSQHGPLLPTAVWGVGSLKGLFVLNGPGVKQGLRLQRTVGLQDLVPTICYLLDLPVPANAEGAVLYQAFVDPNFKRNETLELAEALAKMEAALSGKQE